VTDTSGVVCYDADFYPYGGERPYTNSCSTVYKFEGKERDTEPATMTSAHATIPTASAAGSARIGRLFRLQSLTPT